MPELTELDERELLNRDRRPLGRMMLCQNCIYWEIADYNCDQLIKDNAKGAFSDVVGECRRCAPRPLQHIILHTGQMVARAAFALNTMAKIPINEEADDYEMGSTYEDNVHEWPMTNANAWCGEFKKREEISS
jgi:hypothetical protein